MDTKGEQRSILPWMMVPLPVQRVLRKLGSDIRDARRRRRVPSALLSARASISRSSLRKVEIGDPNTSLGIYAKVLHSLGLVEGIAELADVTRDKTGLQLDEERLPQRVRLPKRPAADEGLERS